MNCGALCKGLSNNNTLTNLAVIGADATGMIDILQLNATKKSLTSFSFYVCILAFMITNLNLSILICNLSQTSKVELITKFGELWSK